MTNLYLIENEIKYHQAELERELKHLQLTDEFLVKENSKPDFKKRSVLIRLIKSVMAIY